MQKGNFTFGVYEGIKEENGYRVLALAVSDVEGARAVDFNFKPYSSEDGLPTIEEGVEVGDFVGVLTFLESQLFEIGKAAGSPTGKFDSFVKRSALKVRPALAWFGADEVVGA